jgi:REP element-mobilizing transposase RayT
VEIPGGIYHVSSRGNAGSRIYDDDEDRRRFLVELGRTTDRFGWSCLSYCLMNTHYHLLVETPQANLARGMRQLNSEYARRFNKRHDRIGHVFAHRYSATLVQRDAHLLEVLRYIALNPVRAGLCSRPADWPWSSHRAMCGKPPAAAFLDLAGARAWFSEGRDPGSAYAAFVDEADETASAPPEPVYGDSEFMRGHLPARRPSSEIAKRHWGAGRPELEQLLAGGNEEQAMVVAFRRYGYTMPEIAAASRRSVATVSRRISAWEARMSGCKT